MNNKKVGYWVYAKYGEWEQVDCRIHQKEDAIHWAKQVSDTDETTTKVIECVYYTTPIKEDEENIDIIEETTIWESDKI